MAAVERSSLMSRFTQREISDPTIGGGGGGGGGGGDEETERAGEKAGRTAVHHPRLERKHGDGKDIVTRMT